MLEMVDPDWETRHGHSSASVRYGSLTWAGPSERPNVYPADPRAAALRRILEQEREVDDEELDELEGLEDRRGVGIEAA
jgi:hypothetical protein